LGAPKPFLKSHGYKLAYTAEYDSNPVVETTPTKPPKDPFYPADDEAFLYRTFWPERADLRDMAFFQLVSVSSSLLVTTMLP